MLIKNKKIILESGLKVEEVEIRIIGGIDNRNYFSLSDSIMSGTIINRNINAVINPFGAFSDPFRTRVKGKIFHQNEGTKIELKVKLGLISIFCILFWLVPLISLIQHKHNWNIRSFFEILSSLLPFILLTYLLLKLKMNSDRKRLEKWLVERLEIQIIK